MAEMQAVLGVHSASSSSSSKPTRHVVGGGRLQKFGGQGASGFQLLTLMCLLVSALNVDAGAASRYRGVSRHKNSRFFHCETDFLRPSPRRKVYFSSFETERMAALACDVAFFYTGMPSAKFNFKWSEVAISNLCKRRALYAALDNWDDRRRFIEAQAYQLLSIVPEFHWEDIIVLEPTDDDQVPTSRQRSEWIAWRIVHHFGNQPRQVREFMACFMEPSTERRVFAVLGQKFPPATHDDVLLSAPQVNDLVHVNMDMNDIIEGVGSLEARPGRILWLLFFFGSALPPIFSLFELNRASGELYGHGVNDIEHDARGTAVRYLPWISERHKDSHHQHDFHTDQKAWLTAINYHCKDGEWFCTGFDLGSKTWRTLPQFSPALPAPDMDLFKEYIVCGHGGLMCADISKSPGKDSLVVFDPLTTETCALPPLLYSRSPVLVHIAVDSESRSFKVIVAGSASVGDEHLSKIIEVFDSTTSRWEEAPELPGPPFGLNQHQTGVCVNGVLYFIAFLEGDGGMGVVAFDVQNRTWLSNRACPLPLSCGADLSQLVENNGKVYLFSERKSDLSPLVEHCIDVLEISNPEEKCQWKKVVRVPTNGRGLSMYPEFACVSFGDGKLCLFDTLNREGVVYDMQDGSQWEELQPPPSDQKDEKFFSLNPASFTLQLGNDRSNPTFAKRAKHNVVWWTEDEHMMMID